MCLCVSYVVFRVVVVGPAWLMDKCFINVGLCVSYVVFRFVFCVVVCVGWAGWDGGQEFVSYAAFGVCVCVSCGVMCWLGRLGWWTSEKKLLAGRSIRPAMMDRGETR